MNKKMTVLLILLLFLSSGCASQNELETTLANSLSKQSLYLVRNGEDSGSYAVKYENIKEIDNNLPDKVDLRELGIVTSVKDQGSYGACWAFAAIAGSETSILNELGLTIDQYQEKYGVDMDLSEFFHVYYGIKSLNDSGTIDGVSIIDPTDEYDPFYIGGNDFNTISIFSNLIGPNYEKDWPIDGEPNFEINKRNKHEFVIQNINLLSSPCTIDENKNYTYNQNGTDSIKQAIANGAPVVISYMASLTKPNYTYESLYNGIKNAEGSEELKDLYVKVRLREIDTSTLTREQLIELIQFRLKANKMELDKYDFTGKDEEFIGQVLLNPYFGQDQDFLYSDIENIIDHYTINPETFAQYNYFYNDADHEVLIIGYDDNYSKDNFFADHKPPQDGAWICKNSWGNQYDEGYFYLSYYDQTITSPTTLDYFLNDEAPNGEVSVYSYDLMPIAFLGSTEFNKKVASSNIYEISEDGNIFALGTNTSTYNTEVEYKVYKLNSKDDKPDKGQLLYSQKETYIYDGYHSHAVNKEIEVKKGDVISVITTQKANGKYILVNGFAISKKGYEAIENSTIDYLSDYEITRYNSSIINEKQSYIQYGNSWYDYKNEIDWLNANSLECNYVTFDNPAIKLFVEK